MIYLLFLSVLLSLITVGTSLQAQTREYLLKAGYVEKFTHFIEWPEVYNSDDTLFRIGIMGDQNMESALKEIFSKVSIRNKRVVINRLSSLHETGKYQILVFSGAIRNFSEVIAKTSGNPVLTISEQSGYGKKGAIINLIVVDNFIRFEVNRKSLEKSGLKMSSLLLNTAIILD